MPERDAGLEERLLAIFQEEARERVTAIADGLSALGDSSPESGGVALEAVFREAHSLKAAAAAAGRRDIEIVCQSMETAFAGLKRGDAVLSPELLAELRRAGDVLEDFVSIGRPADPGAQGRAHEVARALAGVRAPSGPPVSPADAPAPNDGRPGAPTAAAVSARPATGETVRVSIERLDAVLLQAEELLAEKLAARRLSAELRAVVDHVSLWAKEAATVSERPAGAIEAGKTSRDAIRALEKRLDAIGKAAAADTRALGSKVDRLLHDVKQMLTLPCATLFQVIPRAVRELAQAQRKDVRLVLEGGDVEVDRSILEAVKDPLLHLVRNAVDHGIEKPEHRSSRAKPTQATLLVGARGVDGDKIEFRVSDDGAGIPTDRLISAALRMGILSEDGQGRGKSELLPLVFHSGLSTSPAVTEVSGRGLGLAIVREKIEHLGGWVSVESEAELGTTFRLVVPVTLATYRGIEVRLAGRQYILPTLGVERVLRADRARLVAISGRPALDVSGTPVPLVGLRELLELPVVPQDRPPRGRVVAAVLGSVLERVAIEVDAVEGGQEFLVKPLGRCLVRVRNVLGATILPGGAIATVLNVHDLIKSAVKIVRAGRREPVPGETTTVRTARILLVDDSITTRALLKSILETAGYEVRTAADGVDAWSALTSERFDLVVSDIQMPRLDGIALTRRIREQASLSALPVILVTALESVEDRERGIAAGANAYITKGGFDRAALLDQVERLA